MNVMKETLYLKTLNREAILYVGLPNDYDPQHAYPVLYMHDGQNLFFKEDSAYGVTWEVKETFEKDPTLTPCLVVGLSCASGFDRLDEYGPFPFTFDGFNAPRPVGGKGDVYLDVLVNEIMPLIESRYNVKKGPKHTAMMGSSMGGVISVYAAFKYPHIFGRVASISGAFYVSFEAFVKTYQHADFSHLETFYMDTGDQEVGGGKPDQYMTTNEALYAVIEPKLKTSKKAFKIIPGGIHRESAWAERLNDILVHLWS